MESDRDEREGFIRRAPHSADAWDVPRGALGLAVDIRHVLMCHAEENGRAGGSSHDVTQVRKRAANARAFAQ